MNPIPPPTTVTLDLAKTREDLHGDINRFLAGGGRIQVIPTGTSGHKETGKRRTRAQQVAHQKVLDTAEREAKVGRRRAAK